MMLRILLVVAVAASAARAEGIALESYTGERPADASRLLAPVLEELSRKKFTAGDAVARMYETRVSRASRQADGLPSDFAVQVDRGFKSWVAGKFDEAIKVLVPLVEAAHANSGQFAVEPSLRKPLEKALIGLALAHQRIGDPSAMRATFAELVRSFPEAQVARATYGPDAHQAFDQVRREVQAAGRGTLHVKVSDDAAIVFVNEAYRAVGSTSIELFPGEYRVIVMSNKEPSRAHRVTVTPHAAITLEIDPGFDRAIRTASYTGFTFAGAGERAEKEAFYAARFARAIGADAVAVVGIDEVNGRAAVVGVLVSLESGREIRRASIPLEPDPSNERLRALARFLGGEDPAPGLDVQFSGGSSAWVAGGSDDASSGSSQRWGGWRWLTGGAAAAALVAGGVLVGLDGSCSNQPPAGQPCNDLYATATPGYIALGGGAVLAGISITCSRPTTALPWSPRTAAAPR